MKKIICLIMTVIMCIVCVSAASRPRYHEFDSVEKMIHWIQNFDENDIEFDRYKKGIASLKEKGVILVPACKVSFISVKPDEYMPKAGTKTEFNYTIYSLEDLTIREINENNAALIDSGVELYYSTQYGFIVNPDDKKVDAESQDSYIVLDFNTSSGVKSITYYIKDGFEVHFKGDKPFPDGFRLVSLSEPVDLGYEDVKKTDWFYKDVRYVFFNEYIPGTTETTFSPNMFADRATITSALYMVAEEYTFGKIPDFVDVKNNASYYNAVCWAANNGIINGVGDNKFNPDGNVTRQDFAVMLYRYMKHKKIEIPETENAKVFSDDAKIADYAKEAVYTLNTLGIMNGRGNDTIDPKGNVTRAEAAAMLRRMMKIL